MQTDLGELVHWSIPTVTVAVDQNFRSRVLAVTAVEDALEEAILAWNRLPEMRVKLARSVEPEAAAVQVRFCQRRWQRAEGLLGHTEFQANRATGVVSAAVVEINECDYRFVGPDDVASGSMDLQAVITHELGHVLGLAHSADPEAVMFTSTGTVRQRRPASDDRVGLASIYGGAEPAVRAQGDVPDPTRAQPQPASVGVGSNYYSGGKEWPVAFELPWPLTSGNQTARFVPTVLPLLQTPAAPTRSSRAGRDPVPVAPALPRRPRAHRDPDEPVAQDVAWPQAPLAPPAEPAPAGMESPRGRKSQRATRPPNAGRRGRRSP